MNRNKTYERTKSIAVKNTKKIEQKKTWNNFFNSLTNNISEKSQSAWKDLMKGIDHVVVPNIEQRTTKSTNSKITNGIKIDLKSRQQKQNEKAEAKKLSYTNAQTKQNLQSKLRIRTTSKSTQQTHFKSLKKNNVEVERMEEQRKAERIKEINKRKLQLLQKLKKVDSQLQQARRENSPIFDKDQKSLYQSKVNQSFIKNLSNSRSRMSPNPNQSVVEHHSKAVSMLQRINNEKIRRQQKIAQQFRKKQRSQLKKLQQLEKKKNSDFQQKWRTNMEQSMLMRTRQKKQKNQALRLKLNSFKENNDDDNEMMPATMLMTHKKKKGSKIDEDDGFFSIENRPSKHLLTEREVENDGYQNEFEVKMDDEDQIFQENSNTIDNGNTIETQKKKQINFPQNKNEIQLSEKQQKQGKQEGNINQSKAQQQKEQSNQKSKDEMNESKKRQGQQQLIEKSEQEENAHQQHIIEQCENPSIENNNEEPL